MCLYLLNAQAKAVTFDWEGLTGKLLRLAAPKHTHHHWVTIYRSLPFTPRNLVLKTSILAMLMSSRARYLRRSFKKPPPRKPTPFEGAELG